jgi:hypothetical protein
MIKQYESEIGETIFAENIEEASVYLAVGRPDMVANSFLPKDVSFSTNITYTGDTDRDDIGYSCLQMINSDEDIGFVALPTANMDRAYLETLMANSE